MDDELLSQALNALAWSPAEGIDAALLETLAGHLLDTHVAAASITLVGGDGSVTHVGASNGPSSGVERCRYLSCSSGVPTLGEPDTTLEHDPGMLIIEDAAPVSATPAPGTVATDGPCSPAGSDLVAHFYPIDGPGDTAGTVVVYCRHGIRVGEHVDDRARRVAVAAGEHAAIRSDSTGPITLDASSGVERDHLTGLANHTQVLSHLRGAVRHSRRSKLPTAVFYVRLGEVRNATTTATADQRDGVLIEMARRLNDLDCAGHSVMRVADADFVVLCGDVSSPVVADRLSALIEQLVTSCPVGGGDGHVGASIGCVLVSPSGDNADGAIDAARTVMAAGGPGAAEPGAGDALPLVAPLGDLERDLPGAAARGELYVVYQPVIASADGQTSSVEALLRWEHPIHGPIPAPVTISVAERTDQIVRLGRWVLERACRDRARWQERATTVSVSVNVSAQQLMADGFVSSVAQVLSNTSLDPGSLILEMTETVFVDDTSRALVALNELKELGVQIALDDFGTGYATLSYLKRFPADILKLDREFIIDLADDVASQVIVSAVVNLAQLLDMSVTAEGVETVEQQQAVLAAGCQNSQGFLFARPMGSDEVDTFLQQHFTPTTKSSGRGQPSVPHPSVTGRPGRAEPHSQSRPARQPR